MSNVTKRFANPQWKVTDDAAREKEGEIVSVVIHHTGHSDRPVDMMCAGEIGANRYLFVDGVVEEVSRKLRVRGVISFGDGCTSYDPSKERFELCNLPHGEARSEYSVDTLGPDNYLKALKLWRDRHNQEIAGAQDAG